MIIIPILTIFSYSLIFAKIFKVRLIYSVLPVTAILVSTLYISGILGFIYYATYLIYSIGISSLIYCLIIFNKSLINLAKLYLAEIFFLFLITIVFSFYTKDAVFHGWDEFSFWGNASKELLTNHIFEYQALPTAILNAHAHYLRGPAVYHYFMLLLPGYSEGNALFAHFLLHLILITPLMANKFWYQTLFFVAVIFTVVMLYTTGLRTIYNDSTTGLIFSSIFAIYFLEEDKLKALYLVLPILIFLPIFREIGLILSFIAAFIFIFSSYKTISYTKGLPLYIAMIIIPYIAQALWFWHFRATHDFFGRNIHSIDNFISLITSFNEQSKLVVINYIKVILKFLLKEGSIAIYLLLAFSWFCLKKYRQALIKQWYYIIGLLTVGFIIFALWRLYLYLSVFSHVEALESASLLRYCGTYCIVFAIMACCYIKQSLFQIQSTKTKVLILVIISFISSVTVIKNITRVKKYDFEELVYDSYIKYVKELLVQKRMVKFNYANKPGPMECYKLNYKLSPYLTKKELGYCIDTKSDFIKDIVNREIIEPPMITDNNTTIIYYPFLNKLQLTK